MTTWTAEFSDRGDQSNRIAYLALLEKGKHPSYLETMKEEYDVPSGSRCSFAMIFCTRDFTNFKEAFRVHIPRVLIGLLIFFFGLYVNNVSQAWLQEHLAGYYQRHWPPNATLVQEGKMSANDTVTLWDVGYNEFPQVPSTKYADMYAGGAPLVVFVRFFIAPGPYSMRWTYLWRLSTCWGLLWFCRAFTIWASPLPNPDHKCVPKITFPKNIWMEAAANLPILPQYSEITCQDVLYSGHTVALTLNVLFFCEYTKRAPWFECSVTEACVSGITLINVIALFVLLSGYYCIVASHFHYTVDVLVGAMMTFLIFRGYHYAIRMATLEEPHWFSLSRFLRWFEKPAKDMKLFRRQMIYQASLSDQDLFQ